MLDRLQSGNTSGFRKSVDPCAELNGEPRRIGGRSIDRQLAARECRDHTTQWRSDLSLLWQASGGITDLRPQRLDECANRVRPETHCAGHNSREKFLEATPADKVAAIDGFYAYFGTWTVNNSGSTITHHIKQSLYPGERGNEALRKLRLKDDRLTLVAKTHEMGGDHERKLVWERIQPSH